MILSGPVPPNPTALLQGESFQELIDVCRHHYDYVIVDTPPLGLVTDASIIAHQCDASILVIEAGAIKRRAVKKIQERLEQTGAKFLGVVLNKVDVKASHYGAYGAYGAYGSYGNDGNYGKKAE
jgi:capsular exopolysaccharide family